MRERTGQSHRQRILRVLVHLQDHLDDDLDAEALADLASFSRYHFHRVFQALVGETLGQHVRRLRLERAAQRLWITERSITRVALEAGYDSLEAFSRAFRSAFAESPSEFRERRELAARAAAPTNVHYGSSADQFSPLERAAMPVAILSRAAMDVIFMRHTGPYDQVGETWNRLASWAGQRGLLGAGTQFIGISYDDPAITEAANVRYDACIRVTRLPAPEGDVGVRTVAGGEFAMVVHQGPYETLAESYAALIGGWLVQSGRELADRPALEVYLNSPRDAAPADLRTEIWLPLQPRTGS